MITIKKEYENWNEKTQPKNASKVQTTETRRAFYAGCFTLFNLLQEISTNFSEEDSEEILVKLDKEIMDFFDAVENGHA